MPPSPPNEPDDRPAAEAAARQEELRRTIHENAALNRPYVVMNALAAVVASYGLLENSAAVVIGAMIIALLLGPITGLGLALVDGDNGLLRRALLAEVCGVALVLAIGFTVGKIHGGVAPGSQILSRTSPNILDLIIALAGGAAGAYALISPRLSVGLVGVAIATALVPPLCACGICLAHGLWTEGGGAFLLFFTNLVAIQSATSLVLWLNGFHRLAGLERRMLLRRFAPSAVLLAGLAAFLGYSFHETVTREALRARAGAVLRAQIQKSGAADLNDVSLRREGRRTVIVAVVRAPWVVTPASCARLQGLVRDAVGRDDVDLHVRSVLTRECDARGYLWETGPDGTETGTGTGGTDAGGANL